MNGINIGSGALLVLTGMAIIGLIDTFVVEIAKHAGLWQFHLIRAAMALPMLFVIGMFMKQDLRPIRAWAIALRSFFLAASMMLYFGSIPAMPIALVVAGLFTSPVFVLIFSALFLQQSIGRVRIAAVAIGFLGVLFVLNPWDAGFTPAMVLPIIGGALYAMNAIAARRLCAEENTVTMLIGFFGMLGLFGAIGTIVLGGQESADFLTRGWVAPGRELYFWTLIQAVGSIIAVGLLTRAYQSTETTYLVVFEYSLLIFASLWGFLLFDQTVGPTAVVGMMLIVASGTIIALRGGNQSS